MEVFSPERDILLPVLIPLPESRGCCVYVDKDLLVLHSSKYIVKFEAGPNGQLRQLSQKQVPEVLNKLQNSQPVVDRVNGVFYFVDEMCVQVEIETGKWVSRI